MEREQALNQIELIHAVMAENRKIVSSSAPFLILWGLISVAGFISTPYLRERAGLFWTIAGLGGALVSAYLGRRDEQNRGKYAARIGQRVGLIFFGMFVGGWAVTAVLLMATADKVDGQTLGILIGVVWCALIALAWLATGVITDSLPYMLPIAALLLASAFITAFLAPAWFYPAIAVFGGGAMLVAGLIAGARGR